METEFGIEHIDDQALVPLGFDFFAGGKRIVEDTAVRRNGHNWDVSNWEWDSNLFVATPKPAAVSSYSGNFLGGTGKTNVHEPYSHDPRGFNGVGNGDASDKRRKVVVAEELDIAPLTLKLGGNGHEHCTSVGAEAVKNGKRSRMQGGAASQNQPVCQVDDCKVDLNNAKDYHRRHKVCETHAKANNAVVGGRLQRFCQQCSRFHLLEEFDEGKRSCRRRLAGHNRRRRKTHPGHILGSAYLTDERITGSLLLTLLNLLAQMQNSSNSEHAGSNDILVQLLKKLADSNAVVGDKNLSSARQSMNTDNRTHVTCAPETGIQRHENNHIMSNVIANKETLNIIARGQETENSQLNSLTCGSSKAPVLVADKVSVPLEMPENITNYSRDSHQKDQDLQTWIGLREHEPEVFQEKSLQMERLCICNEFDLNDSSDAIEDMVHSPDGPSTMLLLGRPVNVSKQHTSAYHSSLSNGLQASPPVSDNSESASDHSPSSSQGDGQDRTGRIVFKLFGKDPSEIPHSLRLQILDWLAHSPSEIESYIKPGCIILTIYLRLSQSNWKELILGFRSKLENLVKVSDIDFWNKGWIFAQVEQRVAFIFDGQVLLDVFSSFEDSPMLFSVTPVAVAVGKQTDIIAKVLNHTAAQSKILCAFRGTYTVQETTAKLIHDVNSSNHNNSGRAKIQGQQFSWSPHQIGRCFVEVEYENMRGSCFPLIVAEDDVCNELCAIEKYIEFPFTSCEDDTRNNHEAQMKQKMEAIEFLHEFGWLIQKSCMPVSSNGSFTSQTFSSKRFKWILKYAVEQDWCAVVKKVLNIMFSPTVHSDSSVKSIIEEVAILHIAVRRNSVAMVNFLLNYIPPEDRQKPNNRRNMLLRPDMPGAGGLTPLHVAASISNADVVIDALINDPEQVGVAAWSSVRDLAGMTPKDYALYSGHLPYNELVQKKLDMKMKMEHVTVEIPEQLCAVESSKRNMVKGGYTELPHKTHAVPYNVKNTLVVAPPFYCRVCDQEQLRRYRSKTLLYRPALLSMLAIATVCVCVTLLLKGPPEVLFVMPPFRWELVKFGPK